jgi:hypothetical protein
MEWKQVTVMSRANNIERSRIKDAAETDKPSGFSGFPGSD